MSDKYRLMLQQLLPRGPVWTREEGAELTALLQALAVEPQRVEDRGLDLLEEVDPRTTTELITDWERVAGLPGSCTEPVALADRRLLLWQRLIGHGDPNLAFWQEQAEALGFTFVEIIEPRYMAAGFAAGDHCIGLAWTFAWVLVVNSRTAALNTLLQCVLDTISPRHVHLEVAPRYFVTWTIETPDASFAGGFYGLAHDGAVFCAVGTSGEIQTSPDGETWTEQTPAAAYTGTFTAVVSYRADRFCAVGASSEIQTSTDNGVTWAHEAAAAAANFNDVTWNGTVLIAVAGVGKIQTSPASGTWTTRTADAGYANSFTAAAADTTTGLAVIAGNAAEIQWSDDDGVTWNHATPDRGYTGNWVDATFASGFFWLVGATGELQQSRDGVTWRRITNAQTASWLAVADDGDEGILVAAADELHVRTRVGPEMTIESRTAPAAGTPRAMVVYGDACVAVGLSALIWRAEKYGS